MFQHVRMAKFQQVLTSIGAHVVQEMLNLLSEGDNLSGSFVSCICDHDCSVVPSVRKEAL